MNLGQLVRAKQKEMSGDMAGEYIDGQGKHFSMSASGEGYTIGYGGGTKEIEVSKEQACKLAKNCRKLKLAEEKEEAEAEEKDDKKEN